MAGKISKMADLMEGADKVGLHQDTPTIFQKWNQRINSEV